MLFLPLLFEVGLLNKITYKYETKICSTTSSVPRLMCFHVSLLKQTFARPEVTAAGHTQYAANITGQILKFYEDYFGINYQQKTLGKYMTGIMC